MSERCALAVIGGGPAGLATATTAAELGVQVVLFDEQSAPGGQIYRGIENADTAHQAILGQDYARGAALTQSFRASAAGYRSDSDVWAVTPERQIGVISFGSAGIVDAQFIVIATGSMERALPFPGWMLPGVMTAGAGQVLLKQEGMVPDDTSLGGGVVLAGSGPLLLLVASQYLHAGVAIQALLDMTPRAGYLQALPHLPLALIADGYIEKGRGAERGIEPGGCADHFRRYQYFSERRRPNHIRRVRNWQPTANVGYGSTDGSFRSCAERPSCGCARRGRNLGSAPALLAAIDRCMGRDQHRWGCDCRRLRRNRRRTSS